MMKTKIDLLRCNNCQQDAGYYVQTGKHYVFRCLYCGIEHTGQNTKHAGSVLEMTEGSGKTQHVIFRKKISLEAVRHMIRPHRHNIIYAELRSTDQRQTVTTVVMPRRLIRTCVARLIHAYNWLYNFVYKYLYWRIHGKTQK